MSRTRSVRVGQQIVAVAFLLGFATSARARDFIVDDAEDRVDYVRGAGFCRTNRYSWTLRAAIQEASALPGQQTIALGAGEYRSEIDGADEDAAATGDLDVTDDLVIESSGASTTTVQGTTFDQVFDVAEGVNLTLSDLTGSGGLTLDAGAGLPARRRGRLHLRKHDGHHRDRPSTRRASARSKRPSRAGSRSRSRPRSRSSRLGGRLDHVSSVRS